MFAIGDKIRVHPGFDTDGDRRVYEVISLPEHDPAGVSYRARWLYGDKVIMGPCNVFTLARTPDHAVCDACAWEGVETDVTDKSVDYTTGDGCPRCHQLTVNYFHRTSDDHE